MPIEDNTENGLNHLAKAFSALYIEGKYGKAEKCDSRPSKGLL